MICECALCVVKVFCARLCAAHSINTWQKTVLSSVIDLGPKKNAKQVRDLLWTRNNFINEARGLLRTQSSKTAPRCSFQRIESLGLGALDLLLMLACGLLSLRPVAHSARWTGANA